MEGNLLIRLNQEQLLQYQSSDLLFIVRHFYVVQHSLFKLLVQLITESVCVRKVYMENQLIVIMVAVMTINCFYIESQVASGPSPLCFFDNSIAKRLGKVAELICMCVHAEARDSMNWPAPVKVPFNSWSPAHICEIVVAQWQFYSSSYLFISFA